MDFKLVGSILLIVGTSIGAGMLGLPIAAGELGFMGAMVLLLVCWFVMTVSAFLILEVNLWLPQKSNLISMAGATIGPIGQIIAWVTYLLLLYSLLCAYIAGGSDLLRNILQAIHLNIPIYGSSFIFTILFGAVVYLGIRSVDYINRGLMFVKLGAFILLIIMIIPYISMENLSQSNWKYLTSLTAITVTLTSFGFATIVPSLRIYFEGDVRKLRLAILIGSLIPLVCYIAWDAAVMGIIPIPGANGLAVILKSSSANSDMVNTLSTTVAQPSIVFFIKLFTAICMVTSFLGVGLCLTDFLADGLQIEKEGSYNVLIQLLTFLPPLIIVLFYPAAFVSALKYAGIYCIVLMLIIPTWMALLGREKNKNTAFTVPGGVMLLYFMMIFSIILLMYSVYEVFVSF